MEIYSGTFRRDFTMRGNFHPIPGCIYRARRMRANTTYASMPAIKGYRPILNLEILNLAPARARAAACFECCDAMHACCSVIEQRQDLHDAARAANAREARLFKNVMRGQGGQLISRTFSSDQELASFVALPCSEKDCVFDTPRF